MKLNKLKAFRFSLAFQMPIFSHVSNVSLPADFDKNDIKKPSLKLLETIDNNNIHVLSLPVEPIKGDNNFTYEMKDILLKSINLFNLDPSSIITLHNKIKSEIQTKTDMEVEKDNSYMNNALIGEISIASNLYLDIAKNNNAEYKDMPYKYQQDFLKKTVLNDFEASITNPNVVWMLKKMLENENLSDKPLFFVGMPDILYRSIASTYINAKTVIRDYKGMLSKLRQQYLEVGLLNSNEMLTLNTLSKHQIYNNGRLFRNNYAYEAAKHIVREVGHDVVIITDPESKNDFLDLRATKKILEGDFTEAEEIIESYKRFEKMMRRLLNPDMAKLYFDVKKSPEDQGWNFNSNIIDHYLLKPYKSLSKLKNLKHYDLNKRLELVLTMVLFEVAFDTQLLESESIPNKFFYITENEKDFTKIEIEELKRKFYVCYQMTRKIKDDILADASGELPNGNFESLEKIMGLSD